MSGSVTIMLILLSVIFTSKMVGCVYSACMCMMYIYRTQCVYKEPVYLLILLKWIQLQANVVNKNYNKMKSIYLKNECKYTDIHT